MGSNPTPSAKTLVKALILLDIVVRRLSLHQSNARTDWDDTDSAGLFVLVFAVAIIFLSQPSRPGWSAESLRFAYLAFCVWVSLRMWTHIEKPMIALGRRLAAARPYQTADRSAAG
ncbi:hypothetical protein [Bradyrhizobium sp. AZCC 2262]|uniref:hypothetical protein n=1 Tax=Bradyrhizobium sp. AZCC 2262 TaxID=3117022 RepID=UPI002FF036A3